MLRLHALLCWPAAASPLTLCAAPPGGSGGGRIPWCTVAVKVGNGRSATQCKEKWRRLLQHPAALRNEEQEGSTEEEEEEEAQQQQRRRPAQDYEPWSGGEMDDAAALLGAVGARLAGDAGFALAARSFPEKLEAAVRQGFCIHRYTIAQQHVHASRANMGPVHASAAQPAPCCGAPCPSPAVPRAVGRLPGGAPAGVQQEAGGGQVPRNGGVCAQGAQLCTAAPAPLAAAAQGTLARTRAAWVGALACTPTSLACRA